MDAADIEADEAGHQHIDPAQEGHDDDRRAPAGDEVAATGRPHGDHIGAIEQGTGGHREPKPDCDPQRRVGKAHDAVDRKPQHLPKWVLRLACNPRRAMECDLGLLESEPCEHSAHEAILLRHRTEGFEHPAIDEAKITDIARNVDRRELAHELVERRRGPPLERALPHARQPPGIDDVEAFLPLRDHIHHDFGRVLQVGIHHDDRIAHRGIHSSRDGDLVAKVPRQPDVAVARVVLGLGLEDDRAAVDAAIIDQDGLRGRVEQIVEQSVDAPHEHRQDRLFVVNRDDEAIPNIAVGVHGHRWARCDCNRSTVPLLALISPFAASLASRAPIPAHSLESGGLSLTSLIGWRAGRRRSRALRRLLRAPSAGRGWGDRLRMKLYRIMARRTERRSSETGAKTACVQSRTRHPPPATAA